MANHRRLSVLDSTFLRIETPDTPMHVGALMEFAIPDGAPATFVADIVARMREPQPLRRPFNQLLTHGPTSVLAPAAATVETIDMEYHVRHSALPAPGSERELGDLVSHLHSTLLDRTRPMWTSHVIEGLEGNRFAIYMKMHHSLTDGINGIRVATDQLARSVDGDWQPPWQAPTEPRARRAKREGGKGLAPHRALTSLARGFVGLRGGGEPVRLPFQAPRSALNLRVTNARRVATQQLGMERMQAIGRRTSTSLNDVFVALCGDALRRYLGDLGQLPERTLIAGVPVSLRSEGDDGGNAVGYLWADLGTDTDDPLERLEAVRRSMAAAKAHLQRMPSQVRPTFTLLTMSLPVLAVLSGQSPKLPRPPMNVTVSNVPGPRETLYLAGAEMLTCYPISLVFQGMGLNITSVSYRGAFNVGVVGSRDTLPSLQKIAVHLGEALTRLEEASS
ncbi:WS/DGAT/MGAT family O-acyltransferase [Nocardioides montaniterrae]